MRKIHILKAIIDFLWITLIVGYIVFFFLLTAFLLKVDWISPDFTINEIPIKTMSLGTKFYLFLYFLLNGTLSMYCLSLFRKVIDLFKNKKPFDSLVIIHFQNIGTVLIFLTIVNLIYFFIYDLIKITEKGGKFLFPFSLFLFLALGFFFIILSEVFKIAKTAKQENNLTI